MMGFDVPTIGSIMAVVAVLLINMDNIHVQRLAPSIRSASPLPGIVCQRVPKCTPHRRR